MIKTFILYNELEIDRHILVANLKTCFQEHEVIKSIYPKQIHVPFLNKIQSISHKRTGVALNSAEIGCLLSHRKIWEQILIRNDKPNQAYLIVESDAVVNNLNDIEKQFDKMHQLYDLFFWGAFEGRVKLFRSTRKKINSPNSSNLRYTYGSPFIKSLYCTYGYSLNKKSATYLLSVTNQFRYPVDFWKKYLLNCNLSVGAIQPELISIQSGLLSTIQFSNKNSMKKRVLFILVEIKNRIIVFFK